jgi:hypothetical protein
MNTTPTPPQIEHLAAEVGLIRLGMMELMDRLHAVMTDYPVDHADMPLADRRTWADPANHLDDAAQATQALAEALLVQLPQSGRPPDPARQREPEAPRDPADDKYDAIRRAAVAAEVEDLAARMDPEWLWHEFAKLVSRLSPDSAARSLEVIRADVLPAPRPTHQREIPPNPALRLAGA